MPTNSDAPPNTQDFAVLAIAPIKPPVGVLRVFAGPNGKIAAIDSTGASALVGAPAGANTQVQFNDNGAFGGDVDFTWDKTGKVFEVGGSTFGASVFILASTTNGSIVLSTGNSSPTNNRLIMGGAGGAVGDQIALTAQLSANSDLLLGANRTTQLSSGSGVLKLFSTGNEITAGILGSTSGQIDYIGKTSGTANLGVADVAGTPNRLNLPTATAAAGALLTSNGANPQQLSWSTSVLAGTNTLGFYGTAPVAKQTVTGSKGANAALTSLMTALAALGLVTDSTT